MDRKYLPVWYLKVAEKNKEGSTHAFNKKKTKQDHYGPTHHNSNSWHTSPFKKRRAAH